MSSLHRITGVAAAALFFMWFVTGLVLLYHDYPKVSDRDLRSHLEVLPASLPDIAGLSSHLPDTCTRLSLSMKGGRAVFSVAKGDSSYTFCADTALRPLPVDFALAENEARRWSKGNIMAVDTLRERAQWVLYSRYERELPIYRFSFDDDERHQIFVSSRTAEVLQSTTRSQRMWAWVGAIPHKLYFPFIRKDADVWKWTITVGGAFCLLAALSGLYVGISIWLRHRRRNRRGGCPYKTFSHRWHYWFGLVFGIFVIAWGLSGMMAMQKIPRWLVPVKAVHKDSDEDLLVQSMRPLNEYRLDYRQLRSAYPDLKSVEWSGVDTIPVYIIAEGKKERYIDARGSQPKELSLDKQLIMDNVKRLHGPQTTMAVELMHDYDNYYLSRHGMMALPVYRIDVNDEDHTTYYVNPKNGSTRMFDNNKRVRKWVFSGIHYLNIHFLTSRPVLWTVVIWILCIGGAVVTLTGTLLGWKYLRRKIGKRLRKNSKSSTH